MDSGRSSTGARERRRLDTGRDRWVLVWVFWKRSRPKLVFYIEFDVLLLKSANAMEHVLLTGDKVNGNMFSIE